MELHGYVYIYMYVYANFEMFWILYSNILHIKVTVKIQWIKTYFYFSQKLLTQAFYIKIKNHATAVWLCKCLNACSFKKSPFT